MPLRILNNFNLNYLIQIKFRPETTRSIWRKKVGLYACIPNPFLYL